jgi:hypothetical protein
MANRLIITLFVIAAGQASTALTTSNCPSGFIPAAYNHSLAYESQSLADSLYSSIFSPALSAEIKTSIGQGDFDALAQQFTKTSFLLPFMLVSAFFLLLLCMTVCCCAFEKRCPPCKSWQRNYVK